MAEPAAVDEAALSDVLGSAEHGAGGERGGPVCRRHSVEERARAVVVVLEVEPDVRPVAIDPEHPGRVVEGADRYLDAGVDQVVVEERAGVVVFA